MSVLEDLALLEDQAVALWRDMHLSFTETPLLSFLVLIKASDDVE